MWPKSWRQRPVASPARTTEPLKKKPKLKWPPSPGKLVEQHSSSTKNDRPDGDRQRRQPKSPKESRTKDTKMSAISKPVETKRGDKVIHAPTLATTRKRYQLTFRVGIGDLRLLFHLRPTIFTHCPFCCSRSSACLPILRRGHGVDRPLRKIMKEGGWVVITIVTDFVYLGNRHPPYLPPPRFCNGHLRFSREVGSRPFRENYDQTLSNYRFWMGVGAMPHGWIPDD